MKTEEQKQAVEAIKKVLKPGDTVYCVIRRVSRSGMSRDIDFFALEINDDGKPSLRFLSGYIAKILGLKRSSGDGLVIHGAGMDMGFHVVYELSGALGFDRGQELKREWI